MVKAGDPLTSEELAGIMQRKERIDPRRLRTLQDTADFKFKPEGNSKPKMLVHTVRSFFTKKDLAASLPEIRIFVDGEGKVWTLDHRRVVAARVATRVAELHGLDTVFILRFMVVSIDNRLVKQQIIDRLEKGELVGSTIRNIDGLSIEVRRPPRT